MVIASFSPTSVPALAAAFAREVVAEVAPESALRAKALLFASAKLGSYGLSVGLDLSRAVLFDPAVIERFVLAGTAGLSGATRRTLRTNLRCVAQVVRPSASPRPVPLSRERAKAPYTAGEIDAYLALAAAQPTTARVMRAIGLICLGAGAGLIGHDLRSVRGDDVVSRFGGLVVIVGGHRARVVPVLPRYHELLVASALFASDRFVCGGEEPFRRNLTAPVVSSLAGGLHLSRLDTGRLRSSWLSDCAQAIGLRAFMAAAGITCSQRLGDIVAGLPAPSEEEMVALLGARS